MDQFKALMKRVLKRVKAVIMMALIKIMLPVIIIAVLILLITSFIYFITVDDGTYKEDDWTNVPYNAAVYKSEITISNDGKIETGKNAQELWDEMIRKGSRVDEYLDKPEELAKLMNAEVITKFPDTRRNPEQERNWDDIDLSGDKLQGIIKFKRHDKDGNETIMKYIDEGTFYDWMEQYNLSGDETAKKNVMSHFILKEGENESNKDNNEDGSKATKDMKTSVSEEIVKVAGNTGSVGSGYCQKWVRIVYLNAGLGNVGFASATDAADANVISTSKDNIPIGATVYGTGKNSNGCGHVGIYIGNGQVMDQKNTVDTQSLEEWISWQTDNIGGKQGWIGWGWQTPQAKQAYNKAVKNGEGTEDNKSQESDSKKETKANKEKKEGKIETKPKSYYVEVATWSETDTKVESNDPSVQVLPDTHIYNMNTTRINYQQLVDKYSMPFNLLWAFLVMGEDKNFVLELADLVYNSDIEISVCDNYEKDTNITVRNSTKEDKNNVSATATEIQTNISKSIQFEDFKETPYATKTTVITQANTLSISLTKANTWVVNYEAPYSKGETTRTETNDTNQEQDEDFSQNPTSETNIYQHDKITELVQEVIRLASVQLNPIQTHTSAVLPNVNNIVPIVQNNINVKTYSRYKNIVNNITDILEETQYIQEPAVTQEKTKTNSKEPNFVTIYNQYKYRQNKSNIQSASSWLFEIIETNEDTANMVDIVKYLLYKASSKDYGVTKFDFSIYESEGFVSANEGVVEGDYIVKTDETNAAPTVEKEKLKQGLEKWLSGRMKSNAIEVLDKVIEIEKKYKVNAVFTYALLRDESSIGTADSSWVRENNWTSLTALGHIQYPSPQDNLEQFVKKTLCGSYYFKKGLISVNQIGPVYCQDPPSPHWENEVTKYMTELYNACGVSVNTVSTGGNQKIVGDAKSKIGKPYVWGAKGPDSFDCSGFVYWVYKQSGISVPTSTAGYKTYKGSAKEISWDKAKPGDILLIFQEERSVNCGHAAIYLGGDSYIHAPQSGDVVKIVNTGAKKSFKHVFRFDK